MKSIQLILKRSFLSIMFMIMLFNENMIVLAEYKTLSEQSLNGDTPVITNLNTVIKYLIELRNQDVFMYGIINLIIIAIAFLFIRHLVR